ncbi:unnamed protein product [Adineta steineri]|uniref:Uncharacterized protein n=1 Tax=Adineta steineri TaxID=433720 RepID=A0A816C8I5_9BILA|nr:unnamed protein product [Adineta steineri]CAF1620157.1 unnamed protein product [Adineta steineri]
MYHHFLINLIQRFSFLQQYLIILSLSSVFLLIFNRWWCILLLPLSTIIANIVIKRLSHTNQSPLKISGYIYNIFIRKRTDDKISDTTHSFEISLQKECDTYIRIIIARYISVWYYPLISTDQEFPEDLIIIFDIILNRLNDRLKSLNSYDLIRRIINLKHKHMEQYLHASDSYRRQRRENRISKSVVEEFSQIIGFHRSIVNNDIHAYLKALSELFLTDLVPESFHVYSGSHTGKEFLTQIIVNCIFLPLFNTFSNPRMIYYLIVILFETEEQKNAIRMNEDSLIVQPTANINENEPPMLAEDPVDQPNHNDERRGSRLERIIYSATISSHEIAYNARTGAPYTAYVIQMETKSPYAANTIHQYSVRRRFSEFLNLHRRLQQNPITGRHSYDIDEIFRALPIPIDSMNSEIIHRRKCILDQYIQKLISNEVLNCSHDALEFFAYNSDPNILFEPLAPTRLPVPRPDKAFLRTISDVGTKLNNLLPTKRELQIRETFQLNITPTYEKTSSTMDELRYFVRQSSLRSTSNSLTLNPTDTEFLQSLLTRPSIATSRRKEKLQSDIPLTDTTLNLIQTCLHSRDKMINYESTHRILRTIFGHLIEEFLKEQIDDILSKENILMYLVDIREKVLWPADENTFIPMKNVKRRALNACINKIPSWLQQIVGVDNVRRVISNLLDCLSHEELNRHFICNLFDLFIEQLIPNMATEDFLKKYVQMHAGVRS